MARAVVTAGTGGIGLETALGLTQAGYAVTVVGRNAERGAKAVERINARGGEPAQFLQADLASLDDVRTLATRIPDDVTVLVNNVGAMFEDRTMINGVEATFVFTLTAFGLLAGGAYEPGLITAAATAVLAAIGLPLMRDQCRRYAVAQVRAILADPARAEIVHQAFAELFGPQLPQRRAA